MGEQAKGRELERKFVLNNLPNIELGTAVLYDQNYIDTPIPGLIMRVRYEGETRVLQFKLRSEKPGDSDESDKLVFDNCPTIFRALISWASQSTGNAISKQRYIISAELAQDMRECLIDVFTGTNHGHILMEAEFDTVTQKESWQIPSWANEAGCREVTGDIAYTNDEISRKGWPKDG